MKPKGQKAYCGKCRRMVAYTGTRCDKCQRPIWELQATPPEHFEHTLRTTAKTYAYKPEWFATEKEIRCGKRR